jgi:hypothetical protein
MAYMNQEKKQKIAEKVKPLLKKYGVKGSLSVRNHSTIVLTLSEGKLDFIGDLSPERNSVLGHYQIDKDKLRESYNLDVNVYWYQEHYTGKSKEFLGEAIKALKSADWFDKSDISTDFFHTAYYVDLNVGKWNKPYNLIK